MRILWFSNTPANSGEYLNVRQASGGWLSALDILLQVKVELHIAFYFPKRGDSFQYLNTVYHPIGGTKNWKWKALMQIFYRRYLGKQDLSEYLRIVEMVNPDIIHLHGTENPFGYIIPYVDKPVVISMQGCITVISHKYLNGYTKKNLRFNRITNAKGLRELLFHKSFIKVHKELQRNKIRELDSLKAAKYIIGRTDWDRRVSSILAPQSVYFHCDEILREIFYIRTWEFKESQKLIIHTTTANSPIKGFLTICESISTLLSIPGLEFEWQIAGLNGDESIVRAAKRKLKERFPSNKIVYLGFLSECDLINKLCNAHIYVSPSHIENSSNSLSEAMLIGMPCIATFAGGTGSMLTDGEEGILVQDGDPWALAGAILELNENHKLAQQMGAKARTKALIRHNKEKIINDVLSIYHDINRESGIS